MTHFRHSKREIAGIQLAFFETIWPAFEWIESVVLTGAGDKDHTIHVRYGPSPSSEEWAECKAIIREVLNESSHFGNAQVLLEPSSEAPQSESTEETALISKAIFKAIAREAAPWRLDLGR